VLPSPGRASELAEERGRAEQTVLRVLDQGVIVVRDDEVIVASEAVAQILGCSAEEAVHGRSTGRPDAGGLERTVPAPEDRPLARVVSRGLPVRDELIWWPRPDGDRVLLRVSVVPAPEDPSTTVVAFSDITREYRDRLELRRFQALFDQSNDIIVVVDRDFHVLYGTPSSERILGFPHGYRHPGGVLGLVHPDDLNRALTEVQALLDGTRGPAPFPVRIHDVAGRWRHMDVAASNLLDDEAVAGIVLTVRDVSERQLLADQLAHEATHDHLTDLPNRSLVQDRLDLALARADRGDHHVALCFLDLDGFKEVNDRLGHAGGDRVLVRAAEVLQAVIRDGDTAGRLGGDEFVVIIDPVADAAEAAAVAQRMLEALRASGDAPIHCSIGVALDRPGDYAASMISRADDAMYLAKRAGKGRVHLAG
jgi:diguanylate cyclase (GGDEF)-like protein/PAS domain S-box-containing protein